MAGRKRKSSRASTLPLLRWAAEQSPDALMITDSHGVIEYVNPAFEALTGHRRARLVGRTPALLRSGAHDARFYRRLWREILAGREFRGIFVNRRKDGRLFHEEEIIRPVLGPGGRVTHFVCAGRDVSARVREVERFKRAATHDALTRLPNRTLFLDRLAQAVRQAARRKEGVVVAIMDLDGFRAANNVFGHAAGDAVLQAVARRTRRCVRRVDTVARVGGDEFALLLPNVGRRDAAAAVLDKVRSANARPVRFGGKSIPVGVSIGACLYPRQARSESALRRRADAAMYVAKRAGGNRYRFAGERAALL